MRKKFSLFLSMLFAFPAISTLAIPAVSALSEPVTITGNKISKHDDFDYELWRDKGSAEMTLNGGGTFECEWDKEKTSNVLFRMGKKLGSTKSYNEFGDISIDYAADYEIYDGDVSYLCVYGWTENPMIEFYIIENYGNYKPPGGDGFIGMIYVDGGEYGVYTATRVEMPSIQGTKTFEQYFSVRTSKRKSGTITVSEHFKAWEELGLDMSGVMYEVSLCVEGYNSSGYANIYNHVLNIGENTYGTPAEQVELVNDNDNDNELSTETEEPVNEADVSDSEVENNEVTDNNNDIEDETVSNDNDKDNDTDGFKISWIPAAIIGGVIVIAGLVTTYILKKKEKN